MNDRETQSARSHLALGFLLACLLGASLIATCAIQALSEPLPQMEHEQP